MALRTFHNRPWYQKLLILLAIAVQIAYLTRTLYTYLNPNFIVDYRAMFYAIAPEYIILLQQLGLDLELQSTIETLLLVFLTLAAFFILSLGEIQYHFRMMGKPIYEDCEHYVRAQLLTLISTNPGIHPAKLGRDLQIARGTLIYHLRYLEKQNYVIPHKVGNMIQYSLALTTHDDPHTLTIPLRSSRVPQMLTLLAETPGLSSGEISRRLGFSKSDVAYQLKKFQEHGLITRTLEADTQRITLTPKGHTYRESLL